MGVLELLAICVLAFPLQAQILNAQNLTCNSNDLEALKDFLTGLESGINGWDTNSSSSSSSPSNCCNWKGITCASSSSLGLTDDPMINSSRVVKLELSGQRLTGKISQHLAGLDQLRTLNLSGNFLRGSLPPSLFFRFPNLEVLDLSNNDLSGSMTANINLPSLHILKISDNHLSGSIPVGICDNNSRTQTQIRVIDFGFNYFSGSIPPGVVNCSKLENLVLGSNYLTGGIPGDLFRLPKLVQLGLQDNTLSGALSAGLGNLSNLVVLDISGNLFSGAIPDVFHSFAKLRDFSAQSNGFTGRIPSSLSSSSTLSLLVLRNNSLNGSIHLNCSAMTSLVSLNLASNQFTGPIPDNLPLCPQLKTINLARNNFTDQIPETFRNFQSLRHLALSNSSIYNLSAALGILQHCQNLTTLVLDSNFHNEQVPSDPSLKFTSLKAFVIGDCGLTGVFPQWLSGSTQLLLLDLSWNRLGGTIPPWLGNFDLLFYVDLSNNNFRGEIPKNLTRLHSLISGNVSFQEAALDFPFFMKRNMSGRGLQYNQIWSFPPNLDLSCNSLTGPIWPEFGIMKKLHVLDLKYNNLSGSIPSSLSSMTSLEILDLSHNNLSGIIPLSLVNLSFLSQFSVAYNNLYGVIPTAGQFATFPKSSFEGNPGLHGELDSPSPTSNLFPRVSPIKSEGIKGLAIGTAVGIGSGTVFILVLLIVLRAIRG